MADLLINKKPPRCWNTGEAKTQGPTSYERPLCAL
nr:MAG TPA: hypothetical protein [Caudoviricetes sp.]